MSDLVEYAKAELKRAFPDEKDEMQIAAMRDIIKLIETFAAQEHSGMSGAYVLKYFNRLVNFKPITPLTGEDGEWRKCFGDDETEQNIRCCSVFREKGDNSTARDIDARVWVDEYGLCYQGCGSSLPITFPYFPMDEPIRQRRDRETDDNKQA